MPIIIFSPVYLKFYFQSHARNFTRSWAKKEIPLQPESPVDNPTDSLHEYIYISLYLHLYNIY